MKPEILVYGLPKGETETWKEDLLASNCRDLNDVEKVKQAASQAGWHSFRVATFNWEMPNFTNALNI
jgi:hypothetical protein